MKSDITEMTNKKIIFEKCSFIFFHIFMFQVLLTDLYNDISHAIYISGFT